MRRQRQKVSGVFHKRNPFKLGSPVTRSLGLSLPEHGTRKGFRPSGAKPYWRRGKRISGLLMILIGSFT